MSDELEAFLHQIPDVDEKKASELIEYFVFYLTEVKDQPHVAPSDVDRCFEDADIPGYSNVSKFLGNHTRKPKHGHPKFLKNKGGYKLSRARKNELVTQLDMEPARAHVSTQLRELVPKLTNPQEKAFLQETIDCYEIGAHRATVVMAWILAVHHLQQHILKHKLAAFNAVLAKNTDKRVKISSVTKMDDFSEIPEGKFIEFSRSAKIISNDVRKILDEKLGTRNSAAHPSGISVSPVKVTDFVIDLVDNVILKYPR